MTKGDLYVKKIVDIIKVVGILNNIIHRLSVDCVIFGFHEKELKVLLSRIPNTDTWVLQGGFILEDEDVDEAAKRILAERTGLKDIFLQQFHVFGKVNRHFTSTFENYFLDTPLTIDDFPILKERFISVGYYSLVDFQKVNPQPGLLFEQSEWFNIHNLPHLGFDHCEIIRKALLSLRHHLDYELFGFNLMPEVFTMQELQNLYETILEEKLQNNNFQRKILGMNILERLEKQFSGGAHKAPYLYRFKK